MKKRNTLFIFSLLVLTALSGCSKENKKEETQSSERITTESTTTSTVDSTTVTVDPDQKETTPEEIRGKWVAINPEGVTIRFEITESQMIDREPDEKTYDITEYTKDNNTYTLSWDEDSYKQRYGSIGNPQPIIYTYNPEKDTLSNSVEFTRE